MTIIRTSYLVGTGTIPVPLPYFVTCIPVVALAERLDLVTDLISARSISYDYYE
jgi:hypothetical protein